MALAVAGAGAAVKGLDMTEQQVAYTADVMLHGQPVAIAPPSGGALRLKKAVGDHLEQSAQVGQIAQANRPPRLLEL